MHFMLKALEIRLASDPYKMLHDYLQNWILPKRIHQGLANLCLPKRQEANNKVKSFKASANEGLSFFNIFVYFLLQIVVPLNVSSAEVTVLLSLSKIMELLLAIPPGFCPPDQLRQQIADFLQKSLAAKWRAPITGKFLWRLYLPAHL